MFGETSLWDNMATGLTAKIRLVKCPRCRRLLPELPDIPVYKCGGCDAILVGKCSSFLTK